MATAPKIKSKKGPEQLAKEYADREEYATRKSLYDFGGTKIPVVIPTEGYPSEEQSVAATKGDLALTFAIGYNGSDQTARANVKLTPDGSCMIYHIAAICVVVDLASGEQRFYFGHNDDVSCLDVQTAEGSTLVASGQVDPKDRDKADMPKVHIWDWSTMETVCVINKAAFGLVKDVAWSPNSQYMYTMGGDDDQCIRMWDSAAFDKKTQKPMIDNPTCRDECFGMCFSPNPNPSGERVGTIDEFLMWGRRRAAWGYVKSATIKGNIKLFFQYRSINFSKICGKKTENVFLCGGFLPTGQWLVGSPRGFVYIGHETKPICKVQAADSFIGDVHMLGTKFCVAGGDGTVRFYDTTGALNKAAATEDKNMSTEAIKCDGAQVIPRAVRYNSADKSIYIGSKSNQIVKYDTSSCEASIQVDGHDGQIWGLACCPAEGLFLTAGYDGVMKLVDIKTLETKARYEWPLYSVNDKKPQCEKITAAAWSDNGKLIACGTESSKISIFTWLDGVLKLHQVLPIEKKRANAPLEAVAYLRFSPCNGFLGAAHFDSNAYMMSVRALREYAKVELILWKKPLKQNAAVTGCQFSTDSKFLRTFNKNYEVMNWGLNAQKKKAVFCPDIPDPDFIQFAHNPLIAGWDTQGIHLDGWDGTDLNDCAINYGSDSTVLVSGDDFGILRLHSYPSVSTEQKYKEYQAHSAFVVNVEFSNDGSMAVSCGGNDKAIFGWAYTQ